MSKPKKILLLVVIGLVGFFIYSYLFKSSNKVEPPLVSSDNASSQIGRDFIVLLAELKAIKLDETFFADPIFLSLHDSTVTIAPQPVGRRNPFAPIGAPDSF